jgi:hypothetical protein
MKSGLYIESFPEGMPKPAEVLASVFGKVPEDPGLLSNALDSF